jgi:hypothetical protein
MTYTGSVRRSREGKVRGAGEQPSPQEPHVHESDGTDDADWQRNPGLGDRPVRPGDPQGHAARSVTRDRGS